MKKSKIIIPALAMIAFSTAASISGAVAWFTASRQASINAGTYAVVKTNADLGCTVATGVGTLVATNPDNNGTRVIALNNATKSNKLTDGSFNHTDGKFYAPDSAGAHLDPNKSGFTLSDANLEDKLTRVELADGSGTIYTAVTWNVTFTVNFGAVPGNIGLFLDTANSRYVPAGSPTPAATTAKGFRMAFVPSATSTTAVTKVYAPLQTTAKCKYVPELADSGMTGTPYTGNVLISSDTVTALAQEGSVLPEHDIDETTGVARADYFGKFVYDEGEIVTLSYTVVCWFEGTDEEIVNRASSDDYQSVISTLSFRALNLTNA